ncbi:MAG: YolD-like family protein [Acholeplasmataceae bacterium]|nr:YolD-like family protein [Acholeplasmataceae bacterium]
MHNYVDRGIIKWAPFDALVGYQSILSELRHKLGKKDKPLLSVDQHEELNQKLNFVYHHQIEIEVLYYHDGYTKTSYGKIKALDFINKQIILSTYEKISSTLILDLTY